MLPNMCGVVSEVPEALGMALSRLRDGSINSRSGLERVYEGIWGYIELRSRLLE